MPLDDVCCFVRNVAIVRFGSFGQAFLDMRREPMEQDSFFMRT
jgi:hypothetical protein